VEGALFRAAEAAGSRELCMAGKVKMVFFWLHAHPYPTREPQSGIQCPWGLGGKGHIPQLCRQMEMFCRRSLSHAADLSTFTHHTHSSTDHVLSYKAGL